MDKKRQHHLCHLLSGIMSLAAVTRLICYALATTIAGEDAALGETTSGFEANVADCFAVAACNRKQLQPQTQATATTSSPASSCNLPQVGEIKKKFDFTLSQKSAKIRETLRVHQLVASLPVPSIIDGYFPKNVRRIRFM